jgi:ankyrin repeat protein
LFERILYHPLFTAVFNEFRNSDILIKGCRSGNVSALQWLLNLNINPRIQDENGMTALMHASLNPQLLFVVQRLLTINDESRNYVDNKNENALFFAVRNPQAFEELLAAQINPNILNKDRNSILTYCCRNKLYDVVEKLLNKNQVQHIILDLNVVNNEEKTAAMYLIEDGRSNEFNSFLHTNVNLIILIQEGNLP